jgi:hypothetical protein
MDTDQSQSLTIIQDDTYLKIWQAEQEWTRNRWITTTFFMSVSFAILGLSLQAKLSSTQHLAIHFCSLLIYWFAYVLFLHTHDYTKFLRAYLKDMETSGRTTLDLEKRTEKALRSSNGKRLSSAQLLLGFGVLYTFGIALLWLLGL